MSGIHATRHSSLELEVLKSMTATGKIKHNFKSTNGTLGSSQLGLNFSILLSYGQKHTENNELYTHFSLRMFFGPAQMHCGLGPKAMALSRFSMKRHVDLVRVVPSNLTSQACIAVPPAALEFFDGTSQLLHRKSLFFSSACWCEYGEKLSMLM